MKMKNINSIELHIEKLILALAGVFFLAVIWTYVLGSPYTVTIGNEQGIGPDEVEKKIIDQVRLLDQLIGPGTRSTLPEMPVPSYTSAFRDRVSRVSLPVRQFDPLSWPGLDHTFGPGLGPKRGSGATTIPPPPPPIRVQANPGFGLLADDQRLAQYFNSPDNQVWEGQGQVRNGGQLAKAYSLLTGLGSDNEPRDFRYVTVAALYDEGAWRRQLLSTRGSIPEEWWSGSISLTDVVLERQAYDPGKGQWGPVTIIAPLPGMLSFRDPPQTWTREQSRKAVRLIQEEQERILRPDFVPMPDAVRWTRPDVVVEELTGEDHNTVNRLTREIEQIQARLGQAKRGREVVGSSSAATRGRSIFDVESSGNPTVGPPNRSAQIAAMKKVLADKTRQRDTLRSQVALASKQAAGPKPDTDHAAAASPWWPIWAHDLTCQPGVTYRYRLRASVLNPLFQRSQLEDKQNFNKLALDSQPSEWTDPITIEPEYRFFFVGGSGGEHEGTVEVWRVFYGRPRVGEFRVKPGDPIGQTTLIPVDATTAKVDMDINAVVVDLIDVRSSKDIDARTTRMLYLDLKTGRIEHRTIELDRQSPERARLLEQAAVDEAVAEAVGLN